MPHGWEERFADLSAWQTGSDVTLTRKNNHCYAKSKTKDFYYSIALDVSLIDYPVLQVRYLPIFHRGNFQLWVDWVDAEGNKQRSLVLSGGGNQEWQTQQVHLGRLLGLIGEPRRINKITISHPYNWGELEWDYLRLASEKMSAYPKIYSLIEG